MGAQNVAKVFANWRHLSHRDAHALTFMALISLDADNPPVYFGGWEALASALGYDCEGKRDNAKEQFRRTISALVSSGAVVSSGQARLRVRAEYALALDKGITFAPADNGREGSGRGVVWVSVARDEVSTERGTEKVPHVDPQKGAPTPTEKVPHVGHLKGGEWGTEKVPPRRTEEPQGGVLDEQQGGITITQAFSLTNAHEGKADALDGNLSLEDERAKQMAALAPLVAEQKRKAS